MTDQRERIHAHLRTHPGRHFNELTRALDLAPGQVQYHLRRLQANDRIATERLYGRTHYYPPEYDDWERAALALFRRETARGVLLVLLEDGPMAPAAVADDLAIARSTLEWHLDHLTEQDLVRKERDARNRVTLHLERPEATAELLDLIAPSLPERMVDRFTRLVDDVLNES